MEFNRVLFIFNTLAATFRFPMENFFGSHSTAGSITSAELIKVLEILLAFIIPVPVLMVPRLMMFVSFQEAIKFTLIGTPIPQVLMASS